MSMSHRVLTTLGIASISIPAGLAEAHVDDPKIKDAQPPYVGPGYRAAEGGVAGLVFPAEGIALQSWVPIQEFATQNSAANDCWGYTSDSGREYAIIGLSHGTGFAEVTSPADAQVIGFIGGPTSTWRDIKVYGDHAYAVSEGGSGIQVMDLSQIDDGVVTLVNTVLAGGSPSTHNVAINTDSGFLYRTGGSGGGLRIYDLSNPVSPTFVAEWPDRYVHDAQIVSYTEGPYAGREIAFCCSGFNNGWVDTGIDILDVTDKSNIELLSRYEYPNGAYSHQAWLSANKQYLFLNDEQDEADFGFTSTMRVINVSDLSAPFQATTFTNGSTAITHNLYTRDDLVFAANYRSGLRVFDVSSPTVPVEIAYFDTYPENDATNFNGLWSNYPYFPSGTVIGSDREKGLFVWAYDVPEVTIAYPNGRPEFIQPGDTLLVEIQQDGGTGPAGSLSATLEVDSGEGFVSIPLAPIGNHQFEAEFPTIECGTQVRYFVEVQNDDGVTWRDPTGAPSDAYTAIGASGATAVLVDDLEILDNGWVVGAPGDDAETGIWTQVDPIGTLAQPEDDHTVAGTICFVTGQGTVGGPLGEADVDGGRTSLTSPVLDATGDDGIPVVSYARWYSNDQGNNPNADSMLVQISDDAGDTWTLLEEVTENAGNWVVVSFSIADFVAPTDQVRLRFVASDEGDGSIVEAGVDDLRIDMLDCDTAIDPDINGDGVVDVDDLVIVILAWGPCDGPCPADLDGNGAVDVDDLIAVITNWG